jgi:hypothetical protein
VTTNQGFLVVFVPADGFGVTLNLDRTHRDRRAAGRSTGRVPPPRRRPGARRADTPVPKTAPALNVIVETRPG